MSCFSGVLCEYGKMGYEIRYIARCITKSVPTLRDYISATIQDKDLI